MKRSGAEDLIQWYFRKNRMPLILRGARQVGKSTLVRNFCKENTLEIFELNLERGKLSTVERANVTVQEVIDEIQLKLNKVLHDRSVIFFDEIQEQPNLIKFLRYFFEEKPKLAIIAAGSLLEFAIRDKDFSFPVGRVEFQYLGPMTFIEFLLALNEELLVKNIMDLKFSEPVIEKAQGYFQKYLYVGGMPQAVSTYVEERSIVNVRLIQEQILQTYIADFPKYGKRINYDRIKRIFIALVNYIGKKIIYQKIDSQSKSRDIRNAVELLSDARVINLCIHSDGNSVPLSGELDYNIQKLFFLDVGLVNCMQKIDVDTIDSEMNNQFNTKGAMAEQFVAQHIANLYGAKVNPFLCYWLRDKGSQKGEIDFLIENRNMVIPVEVKATEAGHLKSLFYFAKEKKKSFAIKLSLAAYSRAKVNHKIDKKTVQIELMNLPIWAVEALPKVLAAINLPD